jgi:hypothetical protein
VQELPNSPVPPKTWLLESILTTLFCCLPFGIIGIIQASKVEKLFYQGDVLGAAQASKRAKQFSMIAFFIGLLLGILSLTFYALNIGLPA